MIARSVILFATTMRAEIPVLFVRAECDQKNIMVRTPQNREFYLYFTSAAWQTPLLYILLFIVDSCSYPNNRHAHSQYTSVYAISRRRTVNIIWWGCLQFSIKCINFALSSCFICMDMILMLNIHNMTTILIAIHYFWIYTNGGIIYILQLQIHRCISSASHALKNT